MKKFLLTLLLLLLSINISSAQLRIELGTNIKALNKLSELAKIPIRELPIQATIGYEFDISKNLYLEIEGTYSKENILLNNEGVRPLVAKMEQLATVMPSLRKEALFPHYYSSYVKIPLNVGIRLALIGKLALSIEGGPYVKLNINSKIGYEASEKVELSEIKKSLQTESTSSKQAYGLNLSTALAYAQLHLRFGLEYNLTDKIDIGKGVSENFKTIKPLFENINENKLSYYITLGINI